IHPSGAATLSCIIDRPHAVPQTTWCPGAHTGWRATRTAHHGRSPGPGARLRGGMLAHQRERTALWHGIKSVLHEVADGGAYPYASRLPSVGILSPEFDSA